VYGHADGGGQKYAAFFNGTVGGLANFELTGAMQLLIDHPLDPENKTLSHSAVESPESICLYRGKVYLDDAKATVRLPDYFAALTKEDEATVYLTPIGEEPFPTSYIWEEAYTSLTIFGAPSAEVAYLVLAARDDPAIHLFSRPVEEAKGEGNFERGKLLSPEAFGKPPEAGVAPFQPTLVPAQHPLP
jgi:hypothetical protein